VECCGFWRKLRLGRRPSAQTRHFMRNTWSDNMWRIAGSVVLILSGCFRRAPKRVAVGNIDRLVFAGL
jgi:hypothetical protein